MKCMSCGVELTTSTTKIWNKILVCTSCFALAEKAERDINREFARAKEQAMMWLEQHVMSGGLLRGGSGNGTRCPVGGLPVHSPQVQGLRGEEEAGAPKKPVQEG